MKASSSSVPGDRRRAAAWVAAAVFVHVSAPGRADEAPTPAARSLAPIDPEAFRGQYGQEAIFRLRLGVDAADPIRDDKASAAPCPMTSWSASPRKQRDDAAPRGKQSYGAGVALGEWR